MFGGVEFRHEEHSGDRDICDEGSHRNDEIYRNKYDLSDQRVYEK